MDRSFRNPAIVDLVRDAAVKMQARQFAEAESLLRRALSRQASNPDLHYALGVALANQGKLAAAIVYLEQAVTASQNPQYWKTALEVLQAQSDLAGQERLYRKLLDIQPENAAAHFSLGNVLRDLNRLDEAEQAWRAAVHVNPGLAPAHNNLGIAAKMHGDLQGAEQSFRLAINVMPEFAAAHRNLGSVLEQRGDLVGAEQAFRAALVSEPDHADTQRFLGGVLCEQGRLADALDIFMTHAQRRYGPGTVTEAKPSDHRRAHDREQRAWLGDPQIDLNKLSIMGGERLAGAVVNRQDGKAVGDNWRAARPQLMVIDDFLTPAALEELRRFCLGSSIWRESFPGGYLGALPEYGFAVPLLAQLGEELAAAYPDIFCGQPLLQLWAFKYGGTSAGIRLHADFAAVNVNFWITPDGANRNPDHGGLVIWDKAAPQDWDFKKYNNDEDAMRAFLKQSDAKSITVPYRANRAVIFDSDLFHETDMIDFADGYENRRINITLLYGWRGGVKRTG